jgi:hypothetical protein
MSKLTFLIGKLIALFGVLIGLVFPQVGGGMVIAGLCLLYLWLIFP